MLENLIKGDFHAMGPLSNKIHSPSPVSFATPFFSSFLQFVSNSCSNLSLIDSSDVVNATEYMMHRCSNI